MAKMTDRHKLMAYVLSKDFGYSMTKIASLMNVSQSTISTSIKDVNYKKTIIDLSSELSEVKKQAYKLGYKEPELIQANNNEV